MCAAVIDYYRLKYIHVSEMHPLAALDTSKSRAEVLKNFLDEDIFLNSPPLKIQTSVVLLISKFIVVYQTMIYKCEYLSFEFVVKVNVK